MFVFVLPPTTTKKSYVLVLNGDGSALAHDDTDQGPSNSLKTKMPPTEWVTFNYFQGVASFCDLLLLLENRLKKLTEQHDNCRFLVLILLIPRCQLCC